MKRVRVEYCEYFKVVQEGLDSETCVETFQSVVDVVPGSVWFAMRINHSDVEKEILINNSKIRKIEIQECD